MILVTGAAGKTGRAVIRQLGTRQQSVRASVFRQNQAEPLKHLGAVDVVIADLCDPSLMATAMNGIQTVYHICPNMHPDEHEIGRAAIAAASSAGVDRFVYHSVLHPAITSMPHHWQKHLVEQNLKASQLAYTILQPCAYMQNMLPRWDQIMETGQISAPYADSSRLSIIDLNDVAEAAAIVLTSTGHEDATYELCGPESLSQNEVAEILTEQWDVTVRASTVDRDTWERDARAAGLSDYAVDTLLRMFEYYELQGFCGASRDLELLLNRPATTFAEFVRRQAAGG